MTQPEWPLAGVRVLEIGDEKGDYCGKRLAGLGADVIKVEPPGGSPTRAIGPFYQGRRDPEHSLYFWHYNVAKRGITLDLEKAGERRRFLDLVKRSDILIDSAPPADMERWGLGPDRIEQTNRRLVHASITPFGRTGPYAAYKGSDLIHLAMGGTMMNCGYYPDTHGHYETPPMAGQMWQAYQLAVELAVISIMGALLFRGAAGVGQLLDVSVHQVVSCSTERDVPHWLYTRSPFYRMTGRGAQPSLQPPVLAQTKDGRWFMPWARGEDYYYYLMPLLEKHGYLEDLKSEAYEDPEYATRPEVEEHLDHVAKRFINRVMFEGPWREAQELGILWVPVRRPEENLGDPHWNARQTFAPVEHPEIGKTFTYPSGTWHSDQLAWRTGPRAPKVGEHNEEVFAELNEDDRPVLGAAPESGPTQTVVTPSWRKKPFAINHLRILDLTQMLASAGGPHFLAAMGAEVIHLEWRDRPSGLRSQAVPPAAGREALEASGESNIGEYVMGENLGGFHNDIYSGRLGFGLNMAHPKGKELFRRLVEVSDVVTEGFRSGVMDQWGFGYEELKRLNPTIIYVPQSGFGSVGTYGGYRCLGPIAQALSGNTEMIGLPEPYSPCAWGYSFLDWFGAYNLANAFLAGVYYRERTGKSVFIDSSQTEIGIYLSGTALLDFQANGQRWQRIGNRSPWKPAAPHGAYRAQGDDRWVAIACFTDDEWRSLVDVMGKPAWARESRFATLDDRLANQDELDALVEAWTRERDRYEMMHTLQTAGVPAGVCQTAQDRVERDPQLELREWLAELPQSQIGTWPVKQHPVLMTRSPAHIGGRPNRASPAPGEDNDYVFKEVLGLTTDDIEALTRENVI